MTLLNFCLFDHIMQKQNVLVSSSVHCSDRFQTYLLDILNVCHFLPTFSFILQDLHELQHLYITDNNLDHIPLPLPESLQALHLQVGYRSNSSICHVQTVSKTRKGSDCLFVSSVYPKLYVLDQTDYWKHTINQ